jgi:uncharacterized protein YjdB
MKKVYSFLVALLFSVMFLSASPAMGLVFSGAPTSFIDVGSTATAPSQFTVEAWVYYQSFPTGESAYILSTEAQATAGSQGFAFRTIGNKIQLAIGTNTTWAKVAGSTSLSLNTWYHVAATCSGADIKLYVNGVLDGTVTTAAMIPSVANLRIGDSPSWTGRLYNGIISDLRFWNIARTGADISSTMNTSLTGTEPGLIANWKMNEGTGTTLADVKGTYPITKPTDVIWYFPVTEIKIAGTANYLSDLGGTSQFTATVLPTSAIQTVTWNVSDQSFATINSTGLLTAKKNGIVTVTATSKDGSTITSNSIQVTISNQPNIVPAKQAFIDFGPNDVTNGNITLSPDVNGNYWNNAMNEVSGTTTALVDNTNAATGFSLVIGAGMSKNGILNGGLLAPNMSYLGDFAIATATQDYFFGSVGSLKLTGLNPARGYKFKIFGSRDNTEVRTSQFVFTGKNTMTGTLQTSGTNVGGTGINRNVSNILSSDVITPSDNGEVTIAVTKTAGTFFHINVMKIEEYSNDNVPVTGINVDGNDITVTGAASQMIATVSPVNATVPSVSWTVDDTSIATIDANGLLRPLKDGTVTVTATTKQVGSTISGSKQITISNQYLSLFFSGTATENGNDITTAIPMKLLTDLQGNSNGVFELYTNLNATGTFNFYSSQNAIATVYGAGTNTGSIQSSGIAIDPTEAGPVLITVDMIAKTYTILPITKMGVTGANGEVILSYKGRGVWSGIVNMTSVLTDANLNFSFRANSSSTYAIKRVKGTITNAVKMESQATASNIAVEEIGLIDKGSYTVVLDMNHYTYSAVDSLKIIVMGSSVPSGTGATNNQGYIYLYNQQLKQRYTQNKGANWNVVNMSIGGNSTIDVTGRVDRDLYPQDGRYVIFALSLGNEGIHGSSNQQGVFDQWKNNMLSLITATRAKGLVPIVTNNYTRGDFDLSDYGYVKKLNLLIQEWDVPSINLLGAIDDGAGRWATGYQYDVAHPNDAGHAELSYAMIPSLYDALKVGKQFPQRANGNYMTFDNTSGADQLVYTPDNIVHSFTISVDVKTTGTGTIASFKQGLAFGLLKIDATTGTIVYQSPTGMILKGAVSAIDGQWHKITLTHFYARGETDLYSDNIFIGKLTEKLIPSIFTLNDLNSPAIINYRDWFFYRSGMNKDEIAALNNGKMLKSSLELYAPLDGQAIQSADPFANLAQSTTSISKVHLTLTSVNVPVQFSNVKLYPNPVLSKLCIEGLNQSGQYECFIYDLKGRISLHKNIQSGDILNVDTLSNSYYVMVLKDKKSSDQISFSFTKQ